MNLDVISALVLTYNEAPNIARCLNALAWVPRILVIDSGSTDDTVSICNQFPNVSVMDRQFDNHTSQWNFGLEKTTGLWVLCLDADYICPLGLRQELESLEPFCDAYFAGFRYLINSQPLKSTLYPPRAIFFRKDRLRYVADGHTQLLDVTGVKTDFLKSVVDHDDRKPLSRWLSSQVKYASLEAEKLMTTPSAQLGWKDRLRLRIIIAPVLTVIYCLFAKRLILDGLPGLFYTLQRCYAELLLLLELLDRKLCRKSKNQQ